MTDRGKRGKPKTGFPSLPTALGNRKTISTFPQPRPTTAMGKWKSKPRIPTFPRLICLSQPNHERSVNPGLLPCPSGSSQDWKTL